MKFAFVILHYLALNDTIACIESIRKLTIGPEDQLAIVVIDNASKNGSLEEIESTYQKDQQIHIVALPQNAGFAKGNNAGYHYAQETLKSDMMIVLNNDTVILQEDFLDLLKNQYLKDPFDVLGPDILTLKGVHQNPKALKGLTPEAVEQKIIHIRRTILLIKLHIYPILILGQITKKLLWHRLAGRRPEIDLKGNEKSDNWQKPAENIVLHGSCLIFSPTYIKKFAGFYSQTFLYAEEEILWYIAQQENLRLVYSPILKIMHHEDRATQISQKTARQKRLFKLKHEVDSLSKLKRIMQNNELYRRDIMV